MKQTYIKPEIVSSVYFAEYHLLAGSNNISGTIHGGGTGGENQFIGSGEEDEGPANGDAKASNPWKGWED